MATRNINTSSPQYQTRLTQIQEIKAFYKPALGDYLSVEDREAQKAWRNADPILKELLGIWYHIQKREGDLPDDL